MLLLISSNYQIIKLSMISVSISKTIDFVTSDHCAYSIIAFLLHPKQNIKFPRQNKKFILNKNRKMSAPLWFFVLFFGIALAGEENHIVASLEDIDM